MAIHDNLLWLVGNVRETSDWGKAENLLGLFIYYGLQMVENLPAMQETHVRSLGWNDTVEKGMATQSSILALRIPWTEEPGGLQSMGSQRARHNRSNLVRKHKRRNYWGSVPWSLYSAIRSLSNAMKSSPCYLQLEKSPCSNKDPAQPKINKF